MIVRHFSVHNEFTIYDMEERYQTKETANMRLKTLQLNFFVNDFISSMYLRQVVLQDIAKTRLAMLLGG